MDAVTRHPPKARALLAWYDKNRRDLPWRAKLKGQANPYHVWLSEIMLQQTTVATVTPYFEKFLKQWNSLEDLAHAELEDVLLSWAGLGYYTRARNLKRCAETVVSDLGGEFPRTEPELLRLPGIGPYTAAAISAIAFGQKATVVDGNVERVITRLFQIEDPLPKSKPEIGDRAKSLTSPTRPGDYAQAIMDLGATVCRPKSPNCAVCPWVKNCKSAHFGVAEAYPKRMRKKPKPRRSADLLYLLDPEGQVLARKRPDKDCWLRCGSFLLLNGMRSPSLENQPLT